MRIVTEIIAAIRERVRSDFAIGVAVNADESTLGASGIDDGIAQCRILEETGMVDWLRITARGQKPQMTRSEEHTSELQSLMRISYAVFCLKKKQKHTQN